MSEIVVRELVADDLAATARLHIDAFPGSALTKLGVEAVRRYYEWLLTGPHQTTALAGVIENELAGFVFGGTFNGAMTGFLRRNRRYLAARVLTHPWLVTTPLFRERIALAGRLLLRRPRRSSPEPARSPAFGILAIAVGPKWQGCGVGKQLMIRAERIAIERGFERMQLTVASWNQQAIEFYLRGGWEKAVGEGSWTGAMTKPLVSRE